MRAIDLRSDYEPKGYTYASSSDQFSHGRYLWMWSICTQTHRQRRTCLQHGHVRDRVQEGPACVLFAQWYLYALVCHSGRVCMFMWVCSVGVKGHCVGGHQELCEGCCFEVGWDRISRKGQGKKVLRQSPNIIPHITVCLPQLGPSIDPHINTPWPPHYNTDTHAHTRPNHIHWRPLGYRVHKPEEAGEQGARSMRYLFDQHGDVGVITVASSFVYVKGQRSWLWWGKSYNHNNDVSRFRWLVKAKKQRWLLLGDWPEYLSQFFASCPIQF